MSNSADPLQAALAAMPPEERAAAQEAMQAIEAAMAQAPAPLPIVPIPRDVPTVPATTPIVSTDPRPAKVTQSTSKARAAFSAGAQAVDQPGDGVAPPVPTGEAGAALLEAQNAAKKRGPGRPPKPKAPPAEKVRLRKPERVAPLPPADTRIVPSAQGATAFTQARKLERTTAGNDPDQAALALAAVYLGSRGLPTDEASLDRLGWTVVASAARLHESFEDAPALVVYYINPRTGDSITTAAGRRFFQVRYLGRIAGERRWSQEPESGTHVYYPPTVDWEQTRICAVTEGAPKAAAAVAAGVAMVAIQGIECGAVREGNERALHPEFDLGKLHPSPTLVFDRDSAASSHATLAMARALRTLFDLVEAHGAHGVSTKLLPAVNGTEAKSDLNDVIRSLGAARFAAWWNSTDGKDQAPIANRKHGLERYRYHSAEAKYFDLTTGIFYTEAGVNAAVPPRIEVNDAGDIIQIPASQDLRDLFRADQSTWDPGSPTPLIMGKTVDANGEWVEDSRSVLINEYRAPRLDLTMADPTRAEPWVKLVHTVFPGEATELIRAIAFKIQHPGVKINHGIVFQGPQGIGKDTIVHAIEYAIGRHNVASLRFEQAIGEFNPHVKSVFLVINEAASTKDPVGYLARQARGEFLKTLMAAPPMTHLCNEKNRRQYPVRNVMLVLIMTNHLDALYIDPDDRRHFVCVSPMESIPRDANGDAYGPHVEFLRSIWHGYTHGTLLMDVAAYLRTLDVSDFDPNQAPRRTPGWHRMAEQSESFGSQQLREILEHLGDPDAITVSMISGAATLFEAPNVQAMLKSPTMVTSLMAEARFVECPNPGDTKNGRWITRMEDKKIGVTQRKERVWVRASLPEAQRQLAVIAQVEKLRGASTDTLDKPDTALSSCTGN